MRQYLYFRIIILFFVWNFTEICGQTKDELEKSKKSNLEQLEYTKELLESTRNEKKTSLYQLNLLGKQIDLRNNLISNYEYELLYLQKQLDNIEESIITNENRIKNLKDDYALIIRNSYKNIDNFYFWMYILSSEDINQGYERLRYIKYLNNYRKIVINEIKSKNDSLEIMAKNKRKLLYEKEVAINNVKIEKLKLFNDSKSKSTLVNQLKNKEQELIKEIKEREATQRKIENEIRRIIEEEAKKLKNANHSLKLTPEEKIISDDFNKNRGGLPWPTIQGVITGRYGEYDHPVIAGIKIRSNGIDISTVSGADVRSVFKGEVTVVSAILGANYTVIIKHGNYRSVYQNLINVKVKPGEIVGTKEVIGKVGTNSNNESKLHFELWNGMTVVDPVNWLSK